MEAQRIGVFVNACYDGESYIDAWFEIDTLDDFIGAKASDIGGGLWYCFYGGRPLSFTIPLVEQDVPEDAKLYMRIFNAEATADEIEGERLKSMRSYQNL